MLASNEVTEKYCADCGCIKPIANFDVYKKEGKLRYGTYCKTHRRARNNKTTKAYYHKNRSAIIKRAAESRTKPEYREKHREYKIKQNERLSDGIVAAGLSQRLACNTSDIKAVPGIIEAERTRLKLVRKINQVKNSKEGFRICSVCFTELPIDNYRMKAEKRPGKSPYTYRCGQCKKCESKLKNSYGKK